MSTERRYGLSERLFQAWDRVLAEQSSPPRLGMAVALGVGVACSPFLGLQTLMALGLAWALRLNKLAVLAGLQVSVPPLTPLVLLADLQLGALLVDGHTVPLSLSALRAISPKDLVAQFSTYLLVGGLVVGGALGAVLGGLTAELVSRSRRSAPVPRLAPSLLEALGARLFRLPRSLREYGAWKLRLDPVYPLALEALADARKVVDLGGGIGLLAALLAESTPGRRVRSVEWDAKKADAARQLVDGLPGVEVVTGDAREAALGAPDAVVLLDVLHYSPIEQQQAWLQRCAAALAPGGKLVIRELDVRRSRLAEWLDRVAVKVGWNRGAGVHAWPLDEMARFLEGEGFLVEMASAGRGLFSANALVVATRRTSSP